MRLGLFGGSFDPVHYGHLLLAECCREQCRLDRVWFVPAAVAPHKRDQAVSTPDQRVEMLKLAIAGHPGFEVSDIELQRGGVSYTVDTLRSVAAEQPAAELFLLMGADTLADLVNWHQPDEVCRLASPVAVARADEPPPDYDLLAKLVDAERLAKFRELLVSMPQIELSSRELRARVAAGGSIRYRTPRAVEKFIEAEGLYCD
ncbi:MAG: nicotinate (nicotinamide) nucleotide adenylyltransferase [Planctomycetota bacterium]|nr:MAG: nicotinate (nicotinamide) nucleotide adenylyltransferase [Planctomycetota bacterium]REK12600.1 MAG: nicotinate (nicotinamide) nucleotide adenylyltransferase [Planctomycetota bacterium]REK31571.1 MAG: nicotinate (nicotinamide) nucleotide adenylyltransferase [Planctomycetota bacterium]REK40557.1 MAG: nicotinate (nicotinamide) nucleotide adenylyltransferase [Planctomycetota bacterium]